MSKDHYMSGFREHFLDKYFWYRRRYVEHIGRTAPARESLAVLSEVARLGFMLLGTALCGLILGLLAVGAVERDGLRLWPVVYVLLALCAIAFAALTVCGLAVAIRELRAGRRAAP